jgi:4-alpha-glucanotransferase
MTSTSGRRRAGLLAPLFSCPSTLSWGIGDIGDVGPLATWLAGAGLHVWQLLPLNEMAPGQQSPYSAISAMAIDPIYIRIPDIPEFAGMGGERSLDQAERASLDQARRAPRVDYAAVRSLKRAALERAFERFLDTSWTPGTDRSRELQSFQTSQAWWLDDYALYRALRVSKGDQGWTEWPAAVRQHRGDALEGARHDLAREVLFHKYVQWVADTQWQRARAQARARGVALFGDLPFMVDGDSADVWARQHEFQLDASLGVPPDAFSAEGQDWGMPVYRWDVVAAGGFEWLSARARRSADLFDGYRIDHLVGFYRTYGRPRAGTKPFFTPADEEDQIALGERVLALFRAPGAEIIAEDLGTVPDFVRDSLARLGVPGFKVLRWERDWETEGHPFRDPAEYPACSVAASGTHDTEPLIVWWENAPAADRRQVSALPTVQRVTAGHGLPPGVPGPAADGLDGLLEALFASGSDLLLMPVGDVFGWRERINEPATVSDSNWSFRLPWPVDHLDGVSAAASRQRRLRAWAERHGRVAADR